MPSASGGVGSALVQCAKLAGARVIGTTGSPAKRELIESLGAGQGLQQEPPLRESGHAADITARIERRQVLGGVISEYRRAA